MPSWGYTPPGLMPKGEGEPPRLDEAALKELDEKLYSATEHLQYQHDLIREDRALYSGDHWDEDIIRDRDEKEVPSLVFNLVSKFVDFQLGRMAGNDPSPMIVSRDIDGELTRPSTALQVLGKTTGKPYRKADILEGMLRNIFHDSNFRTHLYKAVKDQLVGGLGMLHMYSDYEDGDTLRQCIKIRAINDPTTVLFDPWFENFDGSDISWAAKTKWLEKNLAKKMYPNGDFDKSYLEFINRVMGASPEIWFDPEDKVLLVEYMQLYTVKKMHVYLSDGRNLPKDEYPKIAEELFEQGIEVVGEREKVSREVWMWTLAGRQVVKGPDKLPFESIPIIPLFGKLNWYRNKPVYHGIIREASDPQMAINFLQTSIVQMAQQAASTPWVADPRAIAKYEKDWENIHLSSDAVARFDSYDPLNNTPIAPPARPDPKVVDPATAQCLGVIVGQMDGIIGTDSSGRGLASNASSARSSELRIETQQNSVSEFTTGEERALASVARIFIPASQNVYTDNRYVVVRNRAGQQELVEVNSAVQDQETGEWVKVGDMTKHGEMEVRVELIAGDRTKKQQLVALLSELTKGDPNKMNAYMDKLFRNIDSPFSDELADRALAVLDPSAMTEDEQEQWVERQARAQLAREMVPMRLEALKAELSEKHGVQFQPPQPSPEQIQAQMEQQKGQLDIQKKQLEVQRAEQKNISEDGQARASEVRSAAAITEKELDLRRKAAEVQSAERDAERSTDDRVQSAVNRALTRARQEENRNVGSDTDQ